MINGMLFRPSSDTIEGYKKIWDSSEFFIPGNYKDEYEKHLIAMQHIAGIAKIYILENYKKINIWANLDVIIRDNTKTKTEYYNYIPYVKPEIPFKNDFKNDSSLETERKARVYKSKIFERIEIKMDKRNKEKHNPIISLTDVVLDTSDGDFSLTINGKQHLWIDDNSIIEIANYIEENLKDEPK